MDPQSPQAQLDNSAIDAADLIYPGLSGPPPAKPFPGTSGDAAGFYSTSSFGSFFSSVPSWAWFVLGGVILFRIVR